MHKQVGSGIILLALPFLVFSQDIKVGDEALGSRKYADFEKPQVCGTSCHTDFYQQ